MYRLGKVVRRVACVVAVLTVVLLFVTPFRNNLIPVWPRAWRHLSTLQVVRMYMDTLAGSQSALSPCSEPQHTVSSSTRTASQSEEAALAARQSAADEQLYKRAGDWLNSTADRARRYSRFLPMMTLEDKGRMLATWRALHHACLQHNIPYFLVDGTLLGAFRHGGFIPWDDDFDVAVHLKYADDMQRALSCVPGYTLRVQANMHWKFFAADGLAVNAPAAARTRHARTLTENEKRNYTTEYESYSNVVMRYPFVDIFFMKSDDSFTWAVSSYTSKTNMYLTEDLYPLSMVPFDGYMAPVPRQGRRLLSEVFDLNVCVSPGHNHRAGHGIDDTSEIACEELADMYPIYMV